MKKSNEFLVSEISVATDGYTAFGITNCGTIVIGDVFSKLRRKFAPDETKVYDIDLRVSAIVAYRRQIDELPEGMGGELVLTGTVATTLEANDMLMSPHSSD